MAAIMTARLQRSVASKQHCQHFLFRPRRRSTTASSPVVRKIRCQNRKRVTRAGPAALEEKDRVPSAEFYQIAYARISEPLLRPELTGRPLAQHGAPARATISGA
jgi:hypothetical protein